jgi:hypothetical protein
MRRIKIAQPSVVLRQIARRYGADYVGDSICAPPCVRRTMLRTFNVIETRPVTVSAELRPKYSAFDDLVGLPAGRSHDHAGKLHHSY